MDESIGALSPARMDQLIGILTRTRDAEAAKARGSQSVDLASIMSLLQQMQAQQQQVATAVQQLQTNHEQMATAVQQLQTNQERILNRLAGNDPEARQSGPEGDGKPGTQSSTPIAEGQVKQQPSELAAKQYLPAALPPKCSYHFFLVCPTLSISA